MKGVSLSQFVGRIVKSNPAHFNREERQFPPKTMRVANKFVDTCERRYGMEPEMFAFAIEEAD